MTDTPRGFFRLAGICSILSAFTTLVLIFAPSLFAALPPGLEGRMMRVTDPAYQLRAWIYLVHPFLTFIAGLALAIALFRRAPTLAILGAIGFATWALTEAGQQTLTIFAFDSWRHAWLAGDEAVRASMETRIAIYDGLWAAAYALLLIGFIIANLAIGAALAGVRETLPRVIAATMILAAILSISLLSAEAGGPALPEQVMTWMYPAVQPLGRLLIGVYLLALAGGREPRLKAAP